MNTASPSSPDQSWATHIPKENLGDRAYSTIRDALMRGQLKPGEKLLLRPVSKQFGISVTPMREAFLRLISIDALALDHRGTVVVPTLTAEQLLEIRGIRLDLEGRAAAAAARRATPEAIEGLAQIHHQIGSCLERREFNDAVDLNTRFHLELCRIAELPILLEIVENLWVRCGPIISHLYDAGIPDWSPHPHDQVIDALRARDAEAARAAIQWDIEHGGQGLLRHVRSESSA
ncbi:GntR family transcriptional regulator [Limimaricola variabilis]